MESTMSFQFADLIVLSLTLSLDIDKNILIQMIKKSNTLAS